MTATPGLRILVTRLSHIGDCVLTLPLACALRDHFPAARISWVVEQPSDQLLLNHQAIDELIVVPRGWLRQPRVVLSLRNRLQALGCDLVLDPQSLTKSALAGWLSGAPRRIGLGRPLGREAAPLLNNELLVPRSEHVVDRSVALLQALGVESADVRFGLSVRPESEQKIEQFICDAHLGCGFTVINPGAGWPSRRWSHRRFGAVARHLGQNHQIPSVVAWAGHEERQAAERIVERSGGHAMLSPPSTLLDLVALLRKARFYVGGDTGPMHLAAAVGTPCVALFGPTLPARSGPYGKGHLHVQAFYQQADRKSGNEAMNAIEAEMVVRACEEMLTNIETQQADDQAA